MIKFIRLYFYIICLSVFSFAAQTIVIEGTGDSQELLQKLGEKFEKLHPDIKVIVPNSVGSGGGIQKVIHGQSDFGRVARKLKPQESKYGLSYVLFAYSPVVFVLNGDIPKSFNLSSKDIVNIFSGKVIKWEQIKNSILKGKIYIIKREEGDSSLTTLKNNLVGFKDIKNYVGLAKYSTQETMLTLKKYKNTIGYLPLSVAKDSGLKIIKLNDIYINKLSTPFALVYKNDLTDLNKQFIKFLKTKEILDFMKDYGLITRF